MFRVGRSDRPRRRTDGGEPERSGTYPETGLLKEWPAGGPKLLWETMDAGKGYSSPVIVGDRLYLTE